MLKLEFGLEYHGCVVNELSREVPHLRFVCPGGFILGKNLTDEVLVISNPTDDDVERVVKYLRDSSKITETELLEQTPDMDKAVGDYEANR